MPTEMDAPLASKRTKKVKKIKHNVMTFMSIFIKQSIWYLNNIYIHLYKTTSQLNYLNNWVFLKNRSSISGREQIVFFLVIQNDSGSLFHV